MQVTTEALGEWGRAWESSLIRETQYLRMWGYKMAIGKAVTIGVNGERTTDEFEIGKSYELLREAVGGLIDVVELRGKGVDMWVNDEGLILGLEQNPYGTALYDEEFGTPQPIVGNIIITGACDEEGETLGLTDEQVDFFMNYEGRMLSLIHI